MNAHAHVNGDPFMSEILPLTACDPIKDLIETADFLNDRTWMTLENAILQRATLVEEDMQVYSTVQEIKIIKAFVGHRLFHVWRTSMLYVLAWPDRKGKKVTLKHFLSSLFQKE